MKRENLNAPGAAGALINSGGGAIEDEIQKR